jgi:hypothetical protein
LLSIISSALYNLFSSGSLKKINLYSNLSKRVENHIAVEDLQLLQWKLIESPELKGTNLSWKGDLLTLTLWNELSIKTLKKLFGALLNEEKPVSSNCKWLEVGRNVTSL